MGRVERNREIARRRTRRSKLKKLKGRYEKASSESEKQAIREKVRKISPFMDLEASQAQSQEA